MSQKILVTGGLGYIGSHTVIELVDAGYEPIIVDNLSNASVKILDQLTKIMGIQPQFYQLDLAHESAITGLQKIAPTIQGIIHFAAYKYVAESVTDPLKYYGNNLYALINVLKAYQASKIINFVFSSSCTVYGNPDQLPVTEAAPIKSATSPYGHTKQLAEKILQGLSVWGSGTYKVISLRYFNPVGAHDSALIGELPIGTPQNLVPLITQTAIGKRKQLVVFGNNYPTLDGSAVRDYIHVVDLAKAHIAALKKMELGGTCPNYDVYNVGTGRGLSVLELIHAFEQATKIKLNYRIGDPRAGDVVQIWGDVSKAKNELNWEAQYDVAAMLLSAWNWEKNVRGI